MMWKHGVTLCYQSSLTPARWRLGEGVELDILDPAGQVLGGGAGIDGGGVDIRVPEELRQPDQVAAMLLEVAPGEGVA